MSKGVYYDFINIYDSTDALTTRMNTKPIESQIWFASVRAQCHCFPTAWKRKSIRMVVGSRPEVTEGGQRFRGHRRTDSHDHSYTSPFSGRREKKKLQTANQSYFLPKIHFSTTYQKMGVLALMVAEIWAISFWRFAYQFCKIIQNASFECEILESNCLSDVLTFKKLVENESWDRNFSNTPYLSSQKCIFT